MTERNFKLCIEGPGAEERAKALSDFIENEFGLRPARQAKGMGPGKELTRSVDPVALTAIVLSVPAAILAAVDLVDRIKKKKKTDSLIQWAKEHPGAVTIITPDGTAIHLHKTDGGTLLDAAGSLGMDLTVEESGSLPFLGECMARENTSNPVDVLHISCHGTFREINEGKNEPILVLETDEGDPSLTTAAELDRALGGNKPGLLFLSACKTSDPGEFLTSFSASMIRRGAPAVLGWGGSVGDIEATRFAKSFYGYLSRGEKLEEAAARARMDLLGPGKSNESTGDAQSKDWHLARLYLGGSGGGTLCGGQKAFKRREPEYGHKEFLNVKDNEIPVAGRREFVGRRRQVQTVLREFRQPRHAGVLLHGFGVGEDRVLCGYAGGEGTGLGGEGSGPRGWVGAFRGVERPVGGPVP